MSNLMDLSKPIKLADRKGPRFNLRKFRKKIVTRDLYRTWAIKTGSSIDFLTFKRIWRYIALEFQDVMLTESDGALLPNSIGQMYVGYVKTKNRPIDYRLSREYNKAIYYENYHSYGNIGKVIYYPCGRYSLSVCNLWNFTAITPFKEKVTQAFRDNPERYKHSRQKKYYGHTSNRSADIPSKESDENS